MYEKKEIENFARYSIQFQCDHFTQREFVHIHFMNLVRARCAYTCILGIKTLYVCATKHNDHPPF